MIDYPAEDLPVQFVLSELVSPAGARVALITLTNGSERKPATLGPVGLENLDTTLEAIRADGAYAAAIVTGTGRTFCAGANLDALSSPPNRVAAESLAREGHRVFAKLSNLGVPTVAAINGTALGGGLELALHCTHRIALENAGPLGLPELGLGLIPGWGGATLLPALIGWDNALQVIVDNAIAGKTLTVARAHDLGIVDQLVADITRGGLQFVDSIPEFSRNKVKDSSDAVRDRINSVRTLFGGRPGNPTDAIDELVRVFEVVQQGSQHDSFAAEDVALSTLMMTAEFRRRLYAFRITSTANKPPVGTPDVAPLPVNRVGVVGAGLMASQIALVFAEKLRVPVVISDVSQDRIDSAITRLDTWLSTRVDKGTLTTTDRDHIMERFDPTLSLNDFADCDLVIEAVFEDLKVKRDVLTQLEKVVREDTVLASNTSSLSIDTMASFLAKSDRVAGIHFFNPVSAMKLVEVVRGKHESDQTLATAVDVSRRLGKTPVLVADRAGFVVNRLLSTFLGESLRAVEGGVSTNVVSSALAPLRLPMSPFALIDLIGHTVTLKMMESLYNSAPERFYVGETLSAVARSTDVSGFGDEIDRRVPASNFTDTSIVHDAIVDALAREVRVMLNESVVSRISDIDLCMINGAGWPTAIGGLTPYLDACGASVRATGQLFHSTARFD